MGSDSETDWAVVQDPDSTTAPADPSPVANANATSALTGISMKGSAFPSSSKSVKIKAPVVIDQAAVDQQYYQSALPPKRPHVPRVNSENAVSMAKKKKEEVRKQVLLCWLFNFLRF